MGTLSSFLLDIFMKTEQKESIGTRIKQVRGSLTQKEFADLLGIGRTTLIRYESDERTPDADFFIRMDNLFHVESAWLLTGRGEESAGHEMSAAEAALLWNYRHCTEEAKEVLEKSALLLPKK